MFTHEHYVPVLKWKQGEYTALPPLAQSIKRRITPVLEIQNVGWDFQHNQPSRTVLAHLTPVPNQVVRHWGTESAFLDVEELAGAPVAPGIFPMRFIADACAKARLLLIPVVCSASDPTTIADAAYVHQTYSTGVAFRLLPGDFGTGTAQATVTALAAATGVGPADTDILLDLGNISDPTSATIVARAMLSGLATPAAWRTLTLVSGSFPINLSGMGTNSVTRVPRADWTVYTSIVAANPIGRTPTYGDYCISHPEVVQMDPTMMRMSGSVRYTADACFVIVKGHWTRSGVGWAQMHTLCQTLIAQPEFCGAAFSDGDEHISLCAALAVGHGNATTWRRVGTNHHLTYLVTQIANHFGFLL